MGADPLAAVEPNELRRARLRARIAAESGPITPAGDGQMTGLLAGQNTPGPPACVPDPRRGWRRVGSLNVVDVLGL